MNYADAAWLPRIMAEVKELTGVLAFGQGRLQQFIDQLEAFEDATVSVNQPKQYQLCLNQHRALLAKLHATIDSLINWKVQAEQSLYQLREFSAQYCLPSRAEQLTLMKVEADLLTVLKDVHQQLSFMQHLQKRLTSALQLLTNKKQQVFPVFEKGKRPILEEMDS
jgi:hypothetical protein